MFLCCSSKKKAIVTPKITPERKQSTEQWGNLQLQRTLGKRLRFTVGSVEGRLASMKIGKEYQTPQLMVFIQIGQMTQQQLHKGCRIGQKGVTAIFNLQEPGEHPFCGDGINPKSGFSYTPETLMNSGISYFNFFWKDLTNPSFEKCLNTIQVMDFIIKGGGRVLVHCHAGQGRTALVIGTYLLYSGIAKDTDDAVKQTKKNRPKCFSKAYNVTFLQNFEKWLINLKTLFPSSMNKQSLENIVYRQGLLLHGDERKFNRFIPKVIQVVLNRLTILLSNTQVDTISVAQVILKSKDTQINEVSITRNQANSGNWDFISSCNSIESLCLVVVHFIQGLSEYAFNETQLKSIPFDLKQLERHQLGFLTSIAEFLTLICKRLDKDTTANLYLKLGTLIVQGRPLFAESMISTLKSLSESKDYIYRSEERQEQREESVSPITKQIHSSTLPKIDPNLIKGVFELNIQPMALRENSNTADALPFEIEQEENGVRDHSV